MRSGHVAWSAAKSPASFFIFGGQSGTSESSPFLGDLVQFSLSNAAQGTWVRLSNGTNVESNVEPNLRANSAIASPPGAIAPVWLFGGFSGYTGGLNDLLHNDLWVAPSTA